jgi:hypothetical protein
MLLNVFYGVGVCDPTIFVVVLTLASVSQQLTP